MLKFIKKQFFFNLYINIIVYINSNLFYKYLIKLNIIKKRNL